MYIVRFMRFLLLFCVVMSMAIFLQPAHAVGFVNDDPAGADHMERMIGVWDIQGRIRSGPTAEFTALNGRSTIQRHYSDGQIREVFELGGRFKGEIFMNYARAHQRFELFQIDMNSSNGSAIFLVGEFGESRLKFRGIENYPQWGIKPSLDIKWEYVFLGDGTFRHEIYLKDPKGDYFLQSDYHYRKAQEK